MYYKLTKHNQGVDNSTEIQFYTNDSIESLKTMLSKEPKAKIPKVILVGESR